MMRKYNNVPLNHGAELLNEMHSGPVSAHTGIAKMTTKIQRYYYWPGIWQDVGKRCNICVVCASRQGQKRSGTAPLLPIPPTDQPMDRLTMDIATLPLTCSGNRYVLVLVYTLTKYEYASAMPNQEATTIADTFLKVLPFGLPKQVLMDHGVQFTSQVFSALCQTLGIQQIFHYCFPPSGWWTNWMHKSKYWSLNYPKL